MTYQAFVCAMKECVSDLVTKNEEVMLRTVTKNNGKELVGLVIKCSGTDISPCIYLEEFYENSKRGMGIKHLAEEVVKVYKKTDIPKSWKVNMLHEYSNIKDKLVFKLINFEKNEKILEEIPHKRFLDLAIVFYILLNEDEHGVASVVVNQEQCKLWGVSLDKLLCDALHNAERLLPANIQPMSKLIEEICEVQDIEELEMISELSEETMYVVTNRNTNLGAACLLYPSVLGELNNLLKEDFYVLPSSIHEVIVMPKRFDVGRDSLDEMIQQINDEHLSEEDVLSDHAYFYDCTTKRLLY